MRSRTVAHSVAGNDDVALRRKDIFVQPALAVVVGKEQLKQGEWQRHR